MCDEEGTRTGVMVLGGSLCVRMGVCVRMGGLLGTRCPVLWTCGGRANAGLFVMGQEDGEGDLCG